MYQVLQVRAQTSWLGCQGSESRPCQHQKSHLRLLQGQFLFSLCLVLHLRLASSASSFCIWLQEQVPAQQNEGWQQKENFFVQSIVTSLSLALHAHWLELGSLTSGAPDRVCWLVALLCGDGRHRHRLAKSCRAGSVHSPPLGRACGQTSG